MTVQDIFYIRGRGTVVTGRVEEGVVRVGDKVRVGQLPPTRVDGVEAFRKVLDQAEPGMDIGLLLRKIDRNDVKARDVVTGEGDGIEPAAPSSGGGLSAPVAEPPAAGNASFAQIEDQRTQFLSVRTAGLMTDEQIDAALAAVAFPAAGRRWKLTAASDSWLSSSDGVSWKHDSPPG